MTRPDPTVARSPAALPARRSSKPIVGIAGGIGSGKSQVARLLEEFGAYVIDADAMAHDELNVPEVRDRLVSWWGPSVVGADGKVIRKRVGEIVFNDPAQRNRLESLIHPRIGIRRDAIIDSLAEQPRVRMIVLDAPLLYEVGLDRMCDSVIFVDADPAIRAERSEKARHWPPGELVRREKSQMSLDTKRARADHICINNSDLASLRQAVHGIVQHLLQPDGSR